MGVNKFNYTSRGAVRRLSDTTQGWKWEPQRTNNFEVQIHLGDLIRNADKHYTSKIDFNNLTENIMLSVANFSAPSADISVIEVPYGNNKAKVAGIPEFPDSAITFNDFIGLDVENILAAWHNLAYDIFSESVRGMHQYKTSANFVEYSPDGSLYRQWIMQGVWLKNFQLGDYAQDNNSMRQISGTLIYDYMYPGESNR